MGKTAGDSRERTCDIVLKNTILYQASNDVQTEILVGRDILNTLPAEKRFLKGHIIIDDRVSHLHRARVAYAINRSSWQHRSMTCPAGENTKTLEHVSAIFEELLNADISKKDCIVAIGGGSITDLAAFTAQQLLRGVPLILMPTTLIAQVDAAIGGKNGLNVGGRKNRIGSFYFPQQVICDTSFLDTLSNRHISSGTAEMIKVFAVTDCRLLKELKSEKGRTGLDDSGKRDFLIARSIQAKVDLLNDDPFERSQKRLLNFGHSFAHFFEEASHFHLTHGEAVMLSMLCESRIAQLAGAGSCSAHEDLFDSINDNLTPACREFRLPPRRMYEAVEDTRRLRGGNDHLVVLSSAGYGTTMKDFDPSLAAAAWEKVALNITEEAAHHV